MGHWIICEMIVGKRFVSFDLETAHDRCFFPHHWCQGRVYSKKTVLLKFDRKCLQHMIRQCECLRASSLHLCMSVLLVLPVARCQCPTVQTFIRFPYGLRLPRRRFSSCMFSVCCVVVAGGHVCDLFLFVFRLFASLFLLSLGSVRVCVCTVCFWCPWVGSRHYFVLDESLRSCVRVYLETSRQHGGVETDVRVNVGWSFAGLTPSFGCRCVSCALSRRTVKFRQAWVDVQVNVSTTSFTSPARSRITRVDVQLNFVSLYTWHHSTWPQTVYTGLSCQRNGYCACACFFPPPSTVVHPIPRRRY